MCDILLYIQNIKFTFEKYISNKLEEIMLDMEKSNFSCESLELVCLHKKEWKILLKTF